MQIDPERIRERYLALPTEDLRQVVEAPEGHYTPEAQSIARSVLAARKPEPVVALAPQESLAEGKRETWSVVGVLAGAGVSHVSRTIFAAVRGADKHPDVFRQVLKDLTFSPWTYALVIGGAVYFWRRRAS